MKAGSASGFKKVLSAATGVLLFLAPFIGAAAELPKIELDTSTAGITRGRAVFTDLCQGCHSLKYLGYQARLSAADAQKAFGKTPPDLSLLAKARGRGTEGARYIYTLLISFNKTPEKNSLFPNIAMPAPFSPDDPALREKAKDAAAFLYYAAEPTAADRTRLGGYVLAYMIVLTALLYFLNRKKWKGLEQNPLVKKLRTRK